MITSLVFGYVFLQATIIQIEACNQMRYINPLELQELDKNNVSLSEKSREIMGKEIDGIIENEMDKLEHIEERKQLKNNLEELLGYGVNSPCIVLALLEANLTGM